MNVARNNQNTKTELFVEIVNGLEPFTNFRKKLHPRCSFGEQIKNSHNTKKKKLVPTLDIIDANIK